MINRWCFEQNWTVEDFQVEPGDEFEADGYRRERFTRETAKCLFIKQKPDFFNNYRQERRFLKADCSAPGTRELRSLFKSYSKASVALKGIEWALNQFESDEAYKDFQRAFPSYKFDTFLRFLHGKHEQAPESLKMLVNMPFLEAYRELERWFSHYSDVPHLCPDQTLEEKRKALQMRVDDYEQAKADWNEFEKSFSNFSFLTA